MLKKLMKKWKLILPLLLLLLAVTIFLLPQPGKEEGLVAQEDVMSISRRSDYPVSGELQDMYAIADVVLLGQYLEFEEAWNMARNPENPAEESKTDYFEGHIYSFAVEQVLKGQAEDEIRINIPYKRRFSGELDNAVVENGLIVQEATKFDPFSVDYLWEFYMEPKPEESCILFLSYNAEEDRYFPAIEPYMIVCKEDGLLELRSNLLLPEEEQQQRFQTEFRTEGGKPLLFEINTSSIEDTISGMHMEEFLLELEGLTENEAEQIVDD
ncbi:MAG: hypothetical protein Q4B50_01795 [Bacillota bacterium]|nr:hypothetical protein [Bacillota bacterium]